MTSYLNSILAKDHTGTAASNVFKRTFLICHFYNRLLTHSLATYNDDYLYSAKVEKLLNRFIGL